MAGRDKGVVLSGFFGGWNIMLTFRLTPAHIRNGAHGHLRQRKKKECSYISVRERKYHRD